MEKKNILIVYASVHGQAALIARRIAGASSAWNAAATVQDVRETRPEDLAGRDSVILVASVHYGHHQRSMSRFVTKNRTRLGQLHSAFISVSGDAADPATRPAAEEYVRELVQLTGWTPSETLVIGGAVKFTKYNWFVRFVTRRALAAKGVRLDPRRDYDYTDWEAVTRFARAFVTGGDVRAA